MKYRFITQKEIIANMQWRELSEEERKEVEAQKEMAKKALELCLPKEKELVINILSKIEDDIYQNYLEFECDFDNTRIIKILTDLGLYVVDGIDITNSIYVMWKTCEPKFYTSNEIKRLAKDVPLRSGENKKRKKAKYLYDTLSNNEKSVLNYILNYTEKNPCQQMWEISVRPTERVCMILKVLGYHWNWNGDLCI